MGVGRGTYARDDLFRSGIDGLQRRSSAVDPFSTDVQASRDSCVGNVNGSSHGVVLGDDCWRVLRLDDRLPHHWLYGHDHATDCGVI